ncbi:MAG: hypothetical protein GC206_13050 [Alphaproteobacteria bacterium]|nr:hypothetical protein [Alphaproteobacteria bacterium]
MAEGWAKNLDVRARARADAQAGLPPLDAETLSQAEADVLSAQARERGRLDGEREAARLEAERTMRRLRPEPPDLAGPLAAARLTLAQIDTRAGPECAAAIAREMRTREDLEAFRRAHQIRRDAVYPQSTLFQAGLLFCAALFEALFSATLFAQEAEQGLLGGAAVAIGLSASNVTLGFLAGFLGLRYIQPRRAAPRILGGAAFAAFLTLAALLNIFAARWRESLSAREAAIDPFAPRLDLFGFAEPQAVVLLMLGAGVWVFAALKGYSGFDDPYPDYGKMHRAHRDAAEDLAALRADAVAALEAPVEDAKAAIDASLAAMREAERKMRAAYEDAASGVEAIDARVRRLEESAQSLIALYRRENVAARRGPGPAYFTAPSPPTAPADDALDGCGALLQATREAIAASQREAADALAALQAETQAIAARFAGG